MWICPTFSRPHRLAQLAETWVECERSRPLFVHVSNQDPKKDEYFAQEWPEGWHLYSTDERWVPAILNDFYRTHPYGATYGFVADDILLRTSCGLEILSTEAEDWFIAYPNDTIQRHRLCTHFCLGAKLVQVLGWLANPIFRHHFIDTTWYLIGVNTGLLRYCPQVIFEHMHPIAGKAEKDDVYAIADSMYETGLRKWEQYVKNDVKKDVQKVLGALLLEFESTDALLRRTA